MKYVYYARPIDQARPGNLPWGNIEREIFAHDLPHYSPADAWSRLRKVNGTVQAVNNLALGGAAVVLAVVPRETATLGVPMELQRAVDLDIPVVLLTDLERGQSAALENLHDCGELQWHRDAREAVLAARYLLNRAVFPVPSFESELAGPPPAPEQPPVSRESHGEATQQAYWTAVEGESAWDSRGTAPKGGYEGDAGYDLHIVENKVIASGERAHIRTGVAVELPPGWWGLIQGRSSSWKKGLSVKASVIDNGYRGELWVDVHNIGPEAVQVLKGDRLAQLIPLPLPPRFDFQEVEALSESERGDRGYGSSGQ